MKSIFREYDIRGIFGKDLTFESVNKIGYCLGQRIKPLGHHVAIGYDARLHSPILFSWLTSGFNAAGITVLKLGLVPTPVAYFANYCEFENITPVASVQITGSHNPPEYNGFKITVDKKPFFGEQIYALGNEILDSIITIDQNESAIAVDGLEQYIAYLTKEFAHLEHMKQVIIDCGNGAGGVAIEPVLQNLNISYIGMYCEPDGHFPNHHPDPSEEENIQDLKHELLKSGGLGLAFDGDADRLAVLTQNYNIKGDELALLFARQMKNPTIIGEVKCSQVMYDEINKFGTAIMWKTGHSNLKVKIRETNADLAAEVSGHLFFNDRYFGYDDAIYSALRVLELIQKGMDLDSELDAFPKTYSTDEIKIKTTDEHKFKIIEKVAELLKNPPAGSPTIKDIITVDGLRVVFENGWGLVRASNTTPILVTRFEADSKETAADYQQFLTQLAKQAEKML